MDKKRINTRKRSRVAKVLPEFCCECDKRTNWSPVAKKVSTEYRGVKHDIQVEMLQCDHCENTIFGEGHLDALQATLEKAHQQHIADFCKARRNVLALNQEDVARLSGLSTITIKRAESGQKRLEKINEKRLIDSLSEASFVMYAMKGVVGNVEPSTWGRFTKAKHTSWSTSRLSSLGVGMAAASVALCASVTVKQKGPTLPKANDYELSLVG